MVVNEGLTVAKEKFLTLRVYTCVRQFHFAESNRLSPKASRPRPNKEKIIVKRFRMRG